MESRGNVVRGDLAFSHGLPTVYRHFSHALLRQSFYVSRGRGGGISWAVLRLGKTSHDFQSRGVRALSDKQRGIYGGHLRKKARLRTDHLFKHYMFAAFAFPLMFQI